MGGASSTPTRDIAKEEKSIEKNETAPVPKQEKTGKAFPGPTSRNLPKAAPAQSNKSEPVASETTKTSIDNDNYSDKSATSATTANSTDTPAIQVDENTSSTTPDESKNAAADESKKEDAPVIHVEELSSGTKVPNEADPLSVGNIASEVEQTDKADRGLKIKQTPSMDARKNEIKKGMPTPTLRYWQYPRWTDELIMRYHLVTRGLVYSC